MDIQAALQAVVARRNLTAAQMRSVMHAIMSGAATPAQIGGFLVGLRMKGETVEEIAAAAGVMRELATPVAVKSGEHLVDTCGTGGDGTHTFNISTAAAFVAAAAGARVAKHGNRSVSSKCGSADVLEALGARIDLSAAQVAQCIDEVGVGFMFAPAHHTATRHAVGPRRELGVRTLFNLLGPLTNPAGAPNQLLGVYAGEWVEPLAQVLKSLGSRHVMVVHAADGLDEISVGADTHVAELNNGEIRNYDVSPAQFDIPTGNLDQLAVKTPEDSVGIIKAVLSGQPGPALDITCLNAGAAIYVAGLAADLHAGVVRARAVIDDGIAEYKLDQFVQFTRNVA